MPPTVTISLHRYPPLRLSVFVLLLLAGGAPWAQAQEDALMDRVPRFEPGPCPFEGADDLQDVQCGTLVVHESRDRPNSRLLRLAVASLASTSDDPAPDPVVFLSGGPGGPSVQFTPRRARHSFWNSLRERRDVIFFDQRGTGYSEPAFCPDMDAVFNTIAVRGLTQAEREAEQVRAAAACRERMLAEGLDFGAYNSAASARDLDDLRRTLGYDAWNLYGVSYGTRLALTALRDTPQGIRSVVLDGVVPPDVSQAAASNARFARSLQLVFDQCTADPACTAAFPSLEDAFYASLQDLEAEPIVMAMEDTARFPDGRIVIDGTLWAAGVFQGLYDHRFVAVLPLAIDAVRERDAAVLAALADGLAWDPDRFSAGLMYAVNCYEEYPFDPPEAIRADAARHPRLGPWQEWETGHTAPICNAWHDVRADSLEQQPVSSDVPALILGGEFDPITPPSFGHRAARTLPNATVVDVRGMSHGVAWRTACTRGLLTTFLDDPDEPLDTRCADDVPGMTFVADVHRSGGAYQLATLLQTGPGLPRMIAGGAVLVLLLSAVVGWPAAALVRRLRGRRPPTQRAAQVARGLAVVAALLLLGFAGGLAYMLMQTAGDNPYVLVFGLPGESAWLLGLLAGAAALVPALLVLTAAALRGRWWSRAALAHYGAVVLACGAGVALLGMPWLT